MARIAKASVADAKGKGKARAKNQPARSKSVQTKPEQITTEKSPNNVSSAPFVKNLLVNGWWLIFVLLALIGAAYFTHPKWYSKIADHLPSLPVLKAQDPRFAVISGRMDSLETKAAALEMKGETVARLQQRHEKFGENQDELRRRLGLFEKSLAYVRKRLVMLSRIDTAIEKNENPQRTRERLVELEKNQVDITSVRAVLVDLEQRLTVLEKSKLGSPTTSQKDTDHKTAMIMAVSQLRYMVERGMAYEREFETLKTLANGNARFIQALPSLGAHAKTGVVSRAILQQKLVELAGTMVAKARKQSAEHWFSNLAAKVGTLVTIRRIDGGEIGSVESLVALAEAQLKAGNLAAAIEAVKSVRSVSSDAASVAVVWLKRAEARHAIEHALAFLNNYAISVLAEQSTSE